MNNAFIRNSLDTVLIPISIALVRLSSLARVKLWNLGWRAVIVWSIPRDNLPPIFILFNFLLIYAEHLWSSGFNNGWTKTANVGRIISLSTLGKKDGYFAF